MSSDNLNYLNNNTYNSLPKEFIYQVFSLLVAFIIIHAVYVSIIRPQAQMHLQHEHQQMKQDNQYVEKRNFYVVIRDYEQEACFILMLWAFAIMAYKGVTIWQQQKQLHQDLLQLPESLPVGPEDSNELLKRLSELPQKLSYYLLPRVLKNAIQRFGATHNVHDTANAVRDVCESEGDRLESELSTIRYIAWAIPSVGFIGTVRGIGDALAQANRAMEGDISGVTQSLGVAFNSTFIALVISIVLMFFIHQLQLIQERLVLDTEAYCDRQLISRLKVPLDP
jgi:biopolymer transport protein ExbB/TolQ